MQINAIVLMKTLQIISIQRDTIWDTYYWCSGLATATNLIDYWTLGRISELQNSVQHWSSEKIGVEYWICIREDIGTWYVLRNCLL